MTLSGEPHNLHTFPRPCQNLAQLTHVLHLLGIFMEKFKKSCPLKSPHRRAQLDLLPSWAEAGSTADARRTGLEWLWVLTHAWVDRQPGPGGARCCQLHGVHAWPSLAGSPALCTVSSLASVPPPLCVSALSPPSLPSCAQFLVAGPPLKLSGCSPVPQRWGRDVHAWSSHQGHVQTRLPGGGFESLDSGLSRHLQRIFSMLRSLTHLSLHELPLSPYILHPYSFLPPTLSS